MSLARLSMLKSPAFLNESESDWDDDFKLLLKAATEVVQLFTGRKLVMNIYDEELYTGDDTNRLWLREWPIDDVISVELWDSLTVAYVEEDDDYYTLIRKRFLQYPALGQETNSTQTSWESTYQNGIRITYAAGYRIDDWDTVGINLDFDVKRDLEYAVCVIAQLMWMEGKKGGARRGVQSMSVSMESITVEKYVSEMPKDIARILNNYRRLGV